MDIPPVGELPAAEDQQAVAELLAAASEAAAAQQFTSAPAGLTFVHEGRQYTVHSQLPTRVTEVTGQLVVQGDNLPAFQPHRMLAFHNAAGKGGIKLLQRQPISSRATFRLGGASGHEVLVGLAYSLAGTKAGQCNPVQGTELGLVTIKDQCRINMRPAAQPDDKDTVLATVHTQRQLVLRRPNISHTHAAPYWRQYQEQWEVGCVALYSFPGSFVNSKRADPPPPQLHAITAAAAPADAAAAAAAGPSTAGAAAADGPAESGGAADFAQLHEQFRDEPSVGVPAGFAISSDTDDSAGGVGDAAASSAASEELLPELEPPEQQAVLSRQLQAVGTVAAELQTELLRVAAGVYGNDSLQHLHQLLPLIAQHNSQQPHQRVMLTQVKEQWFLERSVPHLLVSNVRVWGLSALPVLHPLSNTTRKQLLDAFAELCGDPHTLRALLTARNRNKATPWFTAAHFCNLTAVEWLVGRPELTWRDMLLSTKRGKLFYHITSTQAAAEANTPEDRQRLRQGLVLMLTALANSLQQWLEQRQPGRVQQLKDTVWRRKQQREQRNQQRLLAEQQQLQQSGRRKTGVAGAADLPQEASNTVQPLMPGSVHAAAAAAGVLVPQPGSSDPGSAAAGSSRRRQGSVAVSDDVLWFLKHYMLFHTFWATSRASSPPYNGALLEEVVQELFGFTPRHSY